MRLISITKPGIIFGNIITVLGGFFMASHGHFLFSRLMWTLIGMSLVMACGCVINNYVDRDIDPLMERTKNRATARGEIPTHIIFVYAILLGISGLAILYFGVNHLCMWLGFFGLVIYAGVYTLYAKRKSEFGTELGAISGAMPIVVGYCAVTNNLDVGALLLFLILFLWQMPHSFAIGIYRVNDYMAAGIPVLPAKKGFKTAKFYSVIYVGLFLWASLLPAVFGYKGWYYFIAAFLVSLVWLIYSIMGFFAKDDKKWARKMFSISLLVIILISLILALPI